MNKEINYSIDSEKGLYFSSFKHCVAAHVFDSDLRFNQVQVDL